MAGPNNQGRTALWRSQPSKRGRLQGPYGTFSHWGNALHAFDIAPQSGRCIVAMKGGVASTHDLGLGQDHHHRSFGNYITIDHGNGEYSHYAHLATGSFVVENGQRVEQDRKRTRLKS